MYIMASRSLRWSISDVLQVCETLDRRKGLESSEMWPPPPVAPDADAPAGNDVQTGNTDAVDCGNVAQDDAMPWEEWPVQAKLAMVLDHLRQSYHYCIFCGCQVRVQIRRGHAQAAQSVYAIKINFALSTFGLA